MKELAEPTATRLVQELTGTGLKDHDLDVKYLPPSFTKRGLYKRFCFECGWVLKADHRSNYKTKTPRTDDRWGADKSPEPVGSWGTFRNFWRTHYSNI